MVVLVCGDRNWTNKEMIRSILASLPNLDLVIHGAARGADSLAAEVAVELGIEHDPHPAKWTLFGRSAGPIRNRRMLNLKPDLVIAFHDDLWGRSKGTKDCVEEAMKRGISVKVWDQATCYFQKEGVSGQTP